MGHHATIEREYNPDRGHLEWWFDCDCGIRGERRLSPAHVERDLFEHCGMTPDPIDVLTRRRHEAIARCDH